MTTTFTLERSGSNIIITYSDGKKKLWQAKNLTIKLIKQRDSHDLVTLTDGKLIVELDYTLSTNPANNLSEFIEELNDLLNETVKTSQLINDETDVTLTRVVNNHILDLARNVISDKKSVSLFGRNPSIGTSPEDVWMNGGDYNFLLGATTLEVVSNSSEDDYTGLGCRVILINGLNENLEETAELVPLVGDGISTTTNTFWRINSAYVAQVGTVRGSNYNDIDIQSTGGNLLVGKITGEYGDINTADYGIGKTLLGVYTVPAGKTGYIMSMYANIDTNKTADMWLYTVNNIDDVTPPTSGRILIATIRRAKGAVTKDFTSYIKVPEKSDIWFRAQMDSGTGTFEIETELFLIDN